MSYETQYWAKLQRTGSPHRKSVLMALSEYADERHSCFPSQATLAEDLEISERTVRRALKDLEDAGFVTVETRYGDDGKRTSNRYLLPVTLSSSRSGLEDRNVDYRPPVSSEEPAVEDPENNNSTTLGSSDPDSKQLYRADGTPVALGALPTGVYPIEFEKTWLAYPKERREAKRNTYGAWSATVRREVLGSKRDPHTVMVAIYRAVENYRTAMRDREPRYVKLAQTFLGPGDCWRDYVERPNPTIVLKEWET